MVAGFCLAVLPGFGANLASADAIFVTRAMKATTIAEVYISEDSVIVELEVGMADIAAFRSVLPDAVYEMLGYEPKPLEERLPLFFVEDWVMTADGKPLSGRIQRIIARPRVERDEVTGEPVPPGEGEAELAVFIEAACPLPGRPRSITLRPPGRVGVPVATIGFVVYHENLPVTDFRYLGGEETLDLDWEDPWYSRFRNRNLKRRFDAPISVFLYIENFEVRKEIIVRPKDLMGWVDLGLAGRDTIRVEEQEEIKEKVAAFFADRSPVTIDGSNPAPVLDRIHFVRRSLRRTGVVDPPENLPVVSATLGVIFVYPISALPQKVSMPWSLFNERIRKVPSSATDEAGGLPYFLTPEDSVLVWDNFLTNPTGFALVDVVSPSMRGIGIPLWSALCVLGVFAVGVRLGRGGRGRRRLAGAAIVMATAAVFLWPFGRVPLSFGTAAGLSDSEVENVVSGLLTNVYRAFDFREEGVIYDTLARSVSGDLLTQIYLETRSQLELRSQGGARVKVKEIELQAVESGALEGRVGFTARCAWNVKGSVGHWGHIHTRVNRYDATLTIEPVEGAWKITDLELFEEERVSQARSHDRNIQS